MDNRPAEVFPPGDFLKEELDARAWTQTDLAEILGRSINVVNDIILGKRGITPETAQGLADALGTSAQFWLNLESVYRLSLVGQDDAVSRRARLYAKAPIKDMIRRNWIEPSQSLDILEQRVLDFLGIDRIEAELDFAHAARKSTPYETLTPAQFAWLRRARQLAPAVSAAEFSPIRLRGLVHTLRAITESPEDTRRIPKLLADAGIRFLVVEPLPQTRIDGASFWLNAKSPVIVLSLRYDRIDHFWHTLLHELAHIKNKDGLADNRACLDTDIVGERSIPDGEKPTEEQQADAFASGTLIPQDAMQDFIVRVRPLYSAMRVQGFARTIRVHAGLVVGQLQHRGEISYANLRKLLTPVRQIITHAALTDGWGATLPTSV